MTPNVDLHYCKHCSSNFLVDLPARVSGDFFLVCPVCKWEHYRHFANGEAIHCDINRRFETPRKVYGTN